MSLKISLYVLSLIQCATVVLYFNALQQKKVLSIQYDILRKNHGALSCKCHGIGPNGGFCLNKDKIYVGGNHMWCKTLAKGLRRLFNGQSVYDFGAGLGWYGKALLAEDLDSYRVASYEGFDGAENVDVVFPDRFVKYLDLSQPVYLTPKDWILSIEVGEHIPAQYERNFIGNLHRHNKKGIVLSWAVEGQEGHFHVNNRNNGYIKSIFQQLGYKNDLIWESQLRNITTLPYLKNTLMVFRR